VALAGVGGDALLQRLGIAESVTPIADADAGRAAAAARLVFAISAGGEAGRSAMLAEALARASESAKPPRIIHIANVADLAVPGVRALVRSVGEARGANRIEAATVLLESHDSRLGGRDSPMAMITGAAWRAAQADGLPAEPIEITETGPRDWGWTPEYVDAVQRLAARPAMVDLVVASGHRLSAADIADHAFAFFRRNAADHLRITGGFAPAPAPDPAPVKAATGWSASTYGRDLVRAICEGAADRH
jgi:hypothetical protein